VTLCRYVWGDLKSAYWFVLGSRCDALHALVRPYKTRNFVRYRVIDSFSFEFDIREYCGQLLWTIWDILVLSRVNNWSRVSRHAVIRPKQWFSIKLCSMCFHLDLFLFYGVLRYFDTQCRFNAESVMLTRPDVPRPRPRPRPRPLLTRPVKWVSRLSRDQDMSRDLTSLCRIHANRCAILLFIVRCCRLLLHRYTADVSLRRRYCRPPTNNPRPDCTSACVYISWFSSLLLQLNLRTVC